MGTNLNSVATFRLWATHCVRASHHLQTMCAIGQFSHVLLLCSYFIIMPCIILLLPLLCLTRIVFTILVLKIIIKQVELIINIICLLWCRQGSYFSPDIKLLFICRPTPRLFLIYIATPIQNQNSWAYFTHGNFVLLRCTLPSYLCSR